MIAKVIGRGKGGKAATRGSAARLAAYLLGPGDSQRAAAEAGDAGPGQALGNVHARPRVVAAWDPAAEAAWGAACAAVDWGEEAAAWAALRRVAGDVGSAAAGALPLDRSGADVNLVWHTVLAAHPEDLRRDAAGAPTGEQLLADGDWARIARRLMAETGLDPGDGTGVRWAAVRHGLNNAGADHIHVMAVLVRPDGRRPSIHNDALAAQRTARWAEAEFGLVPGGARGDGRDGGWTRRDRTAGRGERGAADAAAAGRRRGGQPVRPATGGAPAGPPYDRPAWMDPEAWAWLQRFGREAAWTRKGIVRAAVLSAAARAVSMDHLVQLVREQGFAVEVRRRRDDPSRIAGWTVTDPGDTGEGPGGLSPRGERRRGPARPKTYSGSQLGADCTWPALRRHVEVRNRHLSPGRGRIAAGEEEDAMLSRRRMEEAGWDAGLIARALAGDEALADGGDPAAAYWLRDVVWQTAWALEGSRGRHGVWTDAAYIYAAVAEGGLPAGPPPVPEDLAAAMAELQAWIAQAEAWIAAAVDRSYDRDARRDAVLEDMFARRRYAAALMDGISEPRMWLDHDGRWIEIAHARADRAAAHAARAHADAVTRAAEAELRQLRIAAQHDLAGATSTMARLAEARQRLAGCQAQVDAAAGRHADAVRRWRDAVGDLLIDARAGDDARAAAAVLRVDALHGPDRAGSGAARIG